MTAATITAEQFRRACGLWASGVSIVTTTDAARRPYGLTMSAVSSLSLEPPMLLVCLDRGSDTLPALLESRVFCVNVLSSTQQDLSNRFAKKGQDKFAGVSYSITDSGAPILDDTLVSVVCTLQDDFAGGDHRICCGVVERIVTNESVDIEPLLYYGGRYGTLARP